MGTPSATDHWRIDRRKSIDWHEWGEEFVVRVASRAETHLLSPAAGSVLLALLDGHPTLTLQALYARTFDDPAGGSEECGRMAVGEVESLPAIIADFQRLGIVTRQAT